MSAKQNYDVLVVGGGMVGGTVAGLLGQCGWSVLLVDASQPRPFDGQGEVGNRVSAISPGSAAILDQAGVWAAIEQQRHCHYHGMQVEDSANGATIRFQAAELGLPRLGTIIENDLINAALLQANRSSERVTVMTGTKVTSIGRDSAPGLSQSFDCILSEGTTVSAGLVLGCDGPNSVVRRIMGADESVWDYNQAGITCVVRKSQPNPGVAWQRFLATGPLAFLPLDDGRSSIVWSMPAEQAKELLQCDDESFVEALGAESQDWLGQVEQVGPRAAFPLSMRISHRYAKSGMVLLGDAAHVIHPLAGQGVNLGLADVAALVQTMVIAKRAGRHLPARSDLLAYERWRRSESNLMAKGVHALGGFFQQDILSPLRALGMNAVERSWGAKSTFVLRAAGQGPNAPRLAAGDSLQTLLND